MFPDWIFLLNWIGFFTDSIKSLKLCMSFILLGGLQVHARFDYLANYDFSILVQQTYGCYCH